MIVVDNGRDLGCTPIFPGALSNGRTFKATELAAARRYAGLRTIFQLLMTAIGIVERSNSVFMSRWIYVILIYVTWRMLYRKKVSINVATERVSYSLAPLMVWLDHFSCFVMLFFGVYLTNNYFMPPYDIWQIFSLFSAGFVTIIGLAPIWSYCVYRKKIISS